ncbi:hypothetical protein L218DRAFT_1028395 [Marasmius fiardii PR-910]|nr:hypothetical protein L218DRAFT_1028395 [Marasmius fiardii PR-910]
MLDRGSQEQLMGTLILSFTLLLQDSSAELHGTLLVSEQALENPESVPEHHVVMPIDEVENLLNNPSTSQSDLEPLLDACKKHWDLMAKDWRMSFVTVLSDYINHNLPLPGSNPTGRLPKLCPAISTFGHDFLAFLDDGLAKNPEKFKWMLLADQEGNIFQTWMDALKHIQAFYQLPLNHFKSISTFLFYKLQQRRKTSEGASGAGDDSEASSLHMQTHVMEDIETFCNEDRPLQGGLQGIIELQGIRKTDQSNSSGIQVMEGHSGDDHGITLSESGYKARTVGEELKEVGGMGADNNV